MQLLVLAALLICGTQGMSLWGPDCPVRGVYTGATRGVNKLASQTPRFGINSEIFDSYEPGETYEFELGQSEVTDEVQYFHLLSTALEESEECPSLGSWHQLSPTTGPQPRDGCDHVLEYTGGEGIGKFQWTAPECGCVTISGVVVVPGDEYFSDDSDALQGPLTMTLCPQDANTLSTLFDDEFYGEEMEELELIDAMMDEVNDIITDTDDMDGVDDITAEEEEEEEEEEEGSFHRGGRRRGGRGKKGHGKGEGRRGQWRGRQEDAAEGGRRGRGRVMGRDEEERGGKRGRWMGRNDQDEDDEPTGRVRGAMLWKRKMGRRTSCGLAGKRLEKVCGMMEEKEAGDVRSADRSLLTSEALELRRARWVTYREDMLQCCDGSQDDMVDCLKEAHGRKITEKLCRAEDAHFQDGEIPERIEAAQDKCCETQGEEQTSCLMDAQRLMRKLKRQHKRAKHSNGTRVEAICKRVEKQPLPPQRQLSKLPIVQKNRWTTLFTERRLQVAECCKLDEGEQETCLEDVREGRYDRVCAGQEELSPPWTRKDTLHITEECCVMEGDERYECFTEEMPTRGGRGRRGPHHRRGRHGKDKGEEEDEADRKGAKTMNSRRARVWRHKNRRHSRVCCQGGRSAGNALEEELSAPKWRTCNAEAQGYVLDREAAKDNTQLCVNSFRKCCVQSVIRKAREEAVAEAEEGELEDEEEP